MSSFSEQALQEKLTRLTVSQDSIETLSSWMIHHRSHAAATVTKWLQNVHQGDVDRQILLLYLANDVLQNSRRKSVAVFHELFQEPLKIAASLTCSQKSEKGRRAFIRIIDIWRERRIFDAIFLNELGSIIEPVEQEKDEANDPTPTADFKLSLLGDSLTELQKFEGEMKVKSSGLLRSSIDVSSTTSLTKLKDRSAGGKFEADFDSASHQLQEYLECVGIEVDERKNLLDMLNQCKHHHINKTKELKGLLRDYGNIQSHFEKVKDKLKNRIDQIEKASHTATSDPTSKQDITVAGDMEIDSDEEEQEEEPHPLPPMVPPLMSLGPQFPSLPNFAANNFPFSIPRPSRPLALPHNQPHPHPPPPMINSPVPYSPSMPKLFVPRFPTITSPKVMPSLPPLLPRSFPPSNNDRNQQDTVRIAPDIHPTNDSLTNEYHSIGHTNSVAVSSQQDKVTTNDTVDDRLKNLVIQKTIPLSLFQDYSDSDSDGDLNNPYSPSSSNVQDERDGESVPTPNMTPPTPNYVTFSTGDAETTKSVSVLATPTPHDHSVLATPTPHDHSSLNNSKLATPIIYTNPVPPTNYPEPVNYHKSTPPISYPNSATPINQNSTNIRSHNSLAEAVQNLASSISSSSALNSSISNNPVTPENIKITPSLTTLLDKIFPKLSQTLQSDRKRKQDHVMNPEDPGSNTKTPRLDEKPDSNTQFEPNTQGPGSNTQEPGSNTQEPGSNTQEPGSNTQEPGSNTQELSSNTQRPDSNTQRPDSNAQVPGSNTQGPGSNTQGPGYNTQGPGYNTQWLGSNTQEPSSNTQRPDPNAQVPGSNTQGPGYNTQWPGYNTQEPGSNTQRPDSNAQVPGSNTQGPGYNTQGPGYNTQWPGSNTQEPGSNTQRPVSNSQVPGYNTQWPGSNTQRSHSNPPQFVTNNMNASTNEQEVNRYEEEILNISKTVEHPKPSNHDPYHNTGPNNMQRGSLQYTNYTHRPNFPPVHNYHMGAPQVFSHPGQPSFLPPNGGGRPHRFQHNQPSLPPRYY